MNTYYKKKYDAAIAKNDSLSDLYLKVEEKDEGGNETAGGLNNEEMAPSNEVEMAVNRVNSILKSATREQ